jgi:hypothetical protein
MVLTGARNELRRISRQAARLDLSTERSGPSASNLSPVFIRNGTRRVAPDCAALAWAIEPNRVSFSSSSRRRPLKLSVKAFCYGLPGAM